MFCLFIVYILDLTVQIFIYGGVGPLHSDVTSSGVAKAFGVRLVRSLISSELSIMLNLTSYKMCQILFSPVLFLYHKICRSF